MYRDGRGCLDAGQRLAGKPLQSRFQHDSTIKASLLNDPFLLEGSSVHIWNDQRTPPRPLPVGHAVPHDKFNSGWKYTHINVVLFFFLHLSQLRLTQKLSDGSCIYSAGRTDGIDRGPGVDPMGGDRRPDLPAARRKDQAPVSHHNQLQQQLQHNGVSTDDSADDSADDSGISD